MPFWHIRTVAGIAIITGQLLQAFNMWMTARSPAPGPAMAPASQPALG
jgi:cbb3-type cytochrome oxidase subunit 1